MLVVNNPPMKRSCFLKQGQLGQTQSKIQERIQEREKELQDLRKAVETLKVSTDQRRGGQQLAAGGAISASIRALLQSASQESVMLSHFPAPLSHTVSEWAALDGPLLFV